MNKLLLIILIVAMVFVAGCQDLNKDGNRESPQKEFYKMNCEQLRDELYKVHSFDVDDLILDVMQLKECKLE